jgi:hypothetical protein
MLREQKKAPDVPGLLVANQRRKPLDVRYYPKAQIRQGADRDGVTFTENAV